jgi:hypothetical protein
MCASKSALDSILKSKYERHFLKQFIHEAETEKMGFAGEVLMSPLCIISP